MNSVYVINFTYINAASIRRLEKVTLGIGHIATAEMAYMDTGSIADVIEHSNPNPPNDDIVVISPI